MKPLLLLQVLKSIISKDIFKPFTKIIIHKQMTIIGSRTYLYNPKCLKFELDF